MELCLWCLGSKPNLTVFEIQCTKKMKYREIKTWAIFDRNKQSLVLIKSANKICMSYESKSNMCYSKVHEQLNYPRLSKGPIHKRLISKRKKLVGMKIKKFRLGKTTSASDKKEIILFSYILSSLSQQVRSKHSKIFSVIIFQHTTKQ